MTKLDKWAFFMSGVTTGIVFLMFCRWLCYQLHGTPFPLGY